MKNCEKNNTFSYEVRGKYALFTDPITKIGGEKFSYPIPTYQALIGITERIYWKPSIRWYVDKVRIMNPIDMISVGVKPLSYDNTYYDNSNAKDNNGKKGSQLSCYTYLTDVRYQVEVHYEWEKDRNDLECDRCRQKHDRIMQRAIEKGGRFPVFLGTSECSCEVSPCIFGEGNGAYDNTNMSFGIMVHGISYPTSKDPDTYIRLWAPKMEEGVIKFISPSECRIVKKMLREKKK